MADLSNYISITHTLLSALIVSVAYLMKQSYALGKRLNEFRTKSECETQMSRCAMSYVHQDVAAKQDEHTDDRFSILTDRLVSIERKLDRLIETQASGAWPGDKRRSQE